MLDGSDCGGRLGQARARNRWLLAWVAAAALGVSACAQSTPGTNPQPAPSAPGASAITKPTAPDVTKPTVPEADEPLHLYYSVHVHGHQDDNLPYRDALMTDLDEVAAAGLLSHVRTIAAVLEAHGAKGSFHFVAGSAKGLCEYAPGLMNELIAHGHEIGAHGHTNRGLELSVTALEQDCGVVPTTASGLEAMARPLGGGDPTDESMSASMELMTANGIEQALVNLADFCGVPDGDPNGTGNILHPWRPALDVSPQVPCEHSGSGELTVVDHVSIAELIGVTEHGARDSAESSSDAGSRKDVDVHLSDEHFDHLFDLFEAAADHDRSDPSGEVTGWGFVTHTHEYVTGTDIRVGLEPDDPAAVALDSFLSLLDPFVQDGLATWSTAAEVAARLP